MPILLRITIKNLKEDRNKTLLTLLGVSLSIAVVSCILFVTSGYINFMEERARAITGSWSVSVENLNVSDLHKIVGDSKAGFGREEGIGYALLPYQNNVHKPYIYLSKYDQDLQRMSNIELAAGRLPTERGTVAVPSHLVEKFPGKYDLGTEIELVVGRRRLLNGREELGQFSEFNPNKERFDETTKKKFKVVGIIRRPTIEPIFSPGYTVLTSMDEKSHIRPSTTWFAEDSYQAIHEDVQNLDDGKHRVIYNYELLNVTGQLGGNVIRKQLYRTTAGLVFIVFVGLCMLLMTGFTINNRYKEEEYRVYASMGMRRGQMNTMLALEGLLYGLFSLPAGIFLGAIGAKLVNIYFGQMLMNLLGSIRGVELNYYIEPKVVLLIIALSVLMVEAALIFPMLRTAEVFKPRESWEDDFFKNVKKRVDFSQYRKVITKLFGVTGFVAYKGYKRNRRQYFITVLALSLAIIMFVASSGFIKFISQGMQNRIEQDSAYDISLSNKNIAEGLKAFKLVSNLQEVQSSRLVARGSVRVVKEGGYATSRSRTNIIILDDASYTQYLLDNGIVIGSPALTARPQAVAVDSKDSVGNVVVGKRGKLRVDASLSTLPKGVTSLPETKTIVTGIDGFEAIRKSVRGTAFRSDIKIKAYNQRIAYALIRKLCIDNQVSVSGLQDLENARLNMKNIIFLVKLILYALVFCVTCITLVGMFNISTGSLKGRVQERHILQALGATKVDFRKIMCYEALLYVVKAIAVAVIISPLVNLVMYKKLSQYLTIDLSFPASSLLLGCVVVIIIVLIMVFKHVSYIEAEELRSA